MLTKSCMLNYVELVFAGHHLMSIPMTSARNTLHTILVTVLVDDNKTNTVFSQIKACPKYTE